MINGSGAGCGGGGGRDNQLSAKSGPTGNVGLH